MSFIDKIRYGNMPLEHQYASLRDDDLSQKLTDLGLYDQLFKMPPPKNSSETTQKELTNLVRYVENISDITLEFCQKAEDDHLGMFISYLNRHGISACITKEDLDKITDIIYPLLTRLKAHYNRPRPYQLAYYYDLDLYVPIKVPNADTPAYPSGHSFESYILAELLAEKYPEHKIGLLKLGENIGLSRLLIGVHYKSDHAFGRFLGKIIIENQLIDSL